MIGQWADWVNGLVATVSIAADASQEVSGSHDVVTIIAVSALAAMALQDLILAVVRRLVDVIKVMKSVVISARSDGFSVDLEAREASSMRLLPTSWRSAMRSDRTSQSWLMRTPAIPRRFRRLDSLRAAPL